MRYLLLLALLAALLPAPAQAADPCDPAAVIAQANALKSSGDAQKDLAVLIELSKSVQNEASNCRKPLKELPRHPDGTGGRKNPIPLGTSVTITGSPDGIDAEVVFAVTNVWRGNAALKMIQDINSFNSAPPEGFEYLLARITLQYVKGNEEKPQEFNWLMFDSVSKNKVQEFTVVVFNKQTEFGAEIFPDTEQSGYAAYLVYPDDPQPLLQFDGFSSFLYLDAPIYFAAYE